LRLLLLPVCRVRRCLLLLLLLRLCVATNLAH
jgi:hypothetical protein